MLWMNGWIVDWMNKERPLDFYDRNKLEILNIGVNVSASASVNKSLLREENRKASK
ncbi:predicted protein [Sclerotinia sclerotiorum 1980 UF-70]|uniref:Uncharacterized protein n=1 Tax=Sclerotinia sclerotiorum (strain ATCC 18683 / 1980 / Ss-1) TaxID=665079 RepID=A7EVW0_SCLS1|nr:predicted protein [Sclerotinia sclerotiorum 1980 UF-70]EDN93602.1 predicted protein [Sclerotinia sclerotiorum 1980 UF-70]